MAEELREAPPTYALISVFNKEGVVDLARNILASGRQIISTGGTANVLSQEGIPVVPIQDITGNPEAFDGRMKTISFKAEGGILYDRTNPEHLRQAGELAVPNIDLVVCNLYPFEQTVAKPGVTMDEATEQIDIGGPTMIRAAAKNSKSVLVVVDPEDYQVVGEALLRDEITEDLRFDLATKVFDHTAFYDAQIASYRRRGKERFPKEMAIPLRRGRQLRYGENPHQTPAFQYEIPNSNSPLNRLVRAAGQELGNVNLTDIHAGLEAVRLFKEPTAVVIKHNSPCGIAQGEDSAQALADAIAGDPESAFGGVVVLNQKMDLETAKVIADFKNERGSNIDIVAVPDIDSDAVELIKAVRKRTGVYVFGEVIDPSPDDLNYRFIDGGVIVQPSDFKPDSWFDFDNLDNIHTVTEAIPTLQQLAMMRIGWNFASRIRSNTVLVMDKDYPMTRGIGSGQTSRVRSTRIALEQAGEHARGAILVSDSFFPFDDSVKLAAEVGIAAIIQQGGSMRDKDSIKAANDAGIAMVFTGRRAFWH